MPYFYELKATMRPIGNIDPVVAAKKTIAASSAYFKIISLEVTGGACKVHWTTQVGARMSGGYGWLTMTENPCVTIESYEILSEVVIKRKSYLEYLAECRLKGIDPMSPEDFKEKY